MTCLHELFVNIINKISLLVLHELNKWNNICYHSLASGRLKFSAESSHDVVSVKRNQIRLIRNARARNPTNLKYSHTQLFALTHLRLDHGYR